MNVHDWCRHPTWPQRHHNIPWWTCVNCGVMTQSHETPPDNMKFQVKLTDSLTDYTCEEIIIMKVMES